MRTNLEKSYKDKIKNIAKDKNFDPSMLWQNIILERFLVRLSKSPYSKHFILKGGVLLSKLIKIHRYTKDLDFAVKEFKEISKTIENVMDKIINTDVKDGFNFSKIKIGEHSSSAYEISREKSSYGRIFWKNSFQNFH